VHFLGLRDDVDRVLNELAFLVHPARQEPLGRVLLEAAASGLAVIATDVGGTSEIFGLGLRSPMEMSAQSPQPVPAALLVPPSDCNGMAEAIRQLAHSAELRIRLGEQARRRCENSFDVRQSAARLAALYQEVLQ